MKPAESDGRRLLAYTPVLPETPEITLYMQAPGYLGDGAGSTAKGGGLVFRSRTGYGCPGLLKGFGGYARVDLKGVLLLSAESPSFFAGFAGVTVLTGRLFFIQIIRAG